MSRLLAIFGGLLGGLLVPVALVGPTAWLLLPAHALFTAVAAAGALGEGLFGRPARARAWGGWHLVASIGMVAALQVGSEAAQSRYWIVPWYAALVWGWVPMTCAGVAAWAGDRLDAARSARAVGRRKRAEPRSHPAPRQVGG